MAPAAHYAMNRATRQVARFFAGDEHGAAPLPDGWEALPNPGPGTVEEQLARVCPPGFTVVHAPDGWFHPSAPPGLPWRRTFTWAGAVGLVLVLVSVAMFSIALSNGVHCPHCDAQQLGERFAWWASYFEVKDFVALASVPFSLAGAALAERRRWGVLGLLVAAIALAVTPM